MVQERERKSNSRSRVKSELCNGARKEKCGGSLRVKSRVCLNVCLSFFLSCVVCKVLSHFHVTGFVVKVVIRLCIDICKTIV